MRIFDGVGTWSIIAMKMCAALSPSVGPLPKLFCTSDLRDIPNPYHGTGNATDWGNNADQWNGSSEMDTFAVWLAQHFGPWSLEIIHTNQPNVGGGVYWKNGVQVDGSSFYGPATVDAHRGHVHWAITNAGINLAPSPVPPISEGEFPMNDTQAKAAFAALTKVVQDNSQQLVTVIEGIPKGKPNPFGLVGIKDLAARLDKSEAALARIEAALVKLAAK